MHPLKIFTLLSLLVLILNQLSLFFSNATGDQWWLASLLTLPLLLPVKGLWSDRLYTYKWTGFLPMLYFFIGVSEAFVASENGLYGKINILASGVLFLSSMYYSRYLKAHSGSQH